MNLFKKIASLFMHGPSCQEVNEFLADYVDGSLSDETYNRFSAHLKKCKSCMIYLDQYRTTIEMVKQDEEIRIPDQLVDHTVEFLRQRLQQS